MFMSKNETPNETATEVAVEAPKVGKLAAAIRNESKSTLRVARELAKLLGDVRLTEKVWEPIAKALRAEGVEYLQSSASDKLRTGLIFDKSYKLNKSGVDTDTFAWSVLKRVATSSKGDRTLALDTLDNWVLVDAIDEKDRTFAKLNKHLRGGTTQSTGSNPAPSKVTKKNLARINELLSAFMAADFESSTTEALTEFVKLVDGGNGKLAVAKRKLAAAEKSADVQTIDTDTKKPKAPKQTDTQSVRNIA